MRPGARAAAGGGFTLLEMVMAIGIFSIVAVISYAGLTRFLDSYQHVTDREARTRSLQLLFAQLERDLRFLADRAVRDEYGDQEAAFIARPGDPPVPGELMRLSVYRPDTLLPQVSGVQRVAWRFEDAGVYRVSWKVLDRAQDSPEYRRRMLGGVRELAIRFLARDTDDQLVSSDEWQAGGDAPPGIEVLVVLETGESYRRVFEVRDGG